MSMDWQFKIGLGVAIAFGLLPFAVKDMPQGFAYFGVAVGVLLTVWGLIPGHQSHPLMPSLLVIACVAALVGGVKWWLDEYTDTERGPQISFKNMLCFGSNWTKIYIKSV